MAGGLYDPLGTATGAETPRWRPSATMVAAGIVAVAVVTFGIAVLLRGGEERGEPRAVVTIERPSPAVAPAPPASPPAVPSTAAAASPAPPASAMAAPASPSEPRDADVEIQNGVRIIRMRPDPARASIAPGSGSPGVPALRAKP